MWKPEHRLAADRSGLRYPSDLTDGEWAIVEPMIPPSRHNGRKRSVNVREVLNGTSCGPAANGRRCRRTCRQRARCTTISNCGTGTAHWSASNTRSTSRCASRKDVKQVRRWLSSTRRRQKVLKKGGLARSFGLRRGQEGQGSQAAHTGRHVGSPVERRCSFR